MSEEQTFRREVSVEIAEGDGRTLVSRLVPYNQVATVNDGQGPYREMFLPGAFNKQLSAASRIKAFLNYRHNRDIGNQIGHAAKIEDKEDGLHGELRVLETPAGDTALKLYEAGMLDRLSIEFQPIREKVVDGVVQRITARLLGVALVPEGAYDGAAVLAVREDPEEPDSEPDAPEGEPEEEKAVRAVVKPVPFSDEMVELLERVGIDPVLRAIVDKPWDGAASRYADTDAYCAACLIDDNPSGAEKSQAKCHLPYKEPNGDININAVRNALARVGQVQTTAANKTMARNRLTQILAGYNKGS